MFTFPTNHFSATDTPASVEFIRSVSNSTNQSSITDSSVPIGDAYTNRWVVFVVHAGSNAVNATGWSCTIAGGAATLLLSRDGTSGASGGAAMFIRQVSTGTTATCTASVSGGYMQYSGGATYVIRDLQSGTPVDSFIDSQENTGTTSGTLDVDPGGIIIADAGGWTNVSTTSSWSGSASLTEQYDAVLSGSNDLRCSGAIGEFASGGSSLGVTNTMTANYLNNAHGDLMAISMR